VPLQVTRQPDQASSPCSQHAPSRCPVSKPNSQCTGEVCSGRDRQRMQAAAALLLQESWRHGELWVGLRAAATFRLNRLWANKQDCTHYALLGKFMILKAYPIPIWARGTPLEEDVVQTSCWVVVDAICSERHYSTPCSLFKQSPITTAMVRS